jgi:hypothetical protein
VKIGDSMYLAINAAYTAQRLEWIGIQIAIVSTSGSAYMAPGAPHEHRCGVKEVRAVTGSVGRRYLLTFVV